MDKLSFTPSQEEAITNLDQNIVVVAGAGAGKTRVLVERYLNLIRLEKAAVKEIVAITFTNKAAKEMLERIRKEYKADLSQAKIGTFHSFCGDLLRENPVEAGIDPNFKVMSEIESQMLLYKSLRTGILQGIEDKDGATLTLVEEYGFNYLLKYLPSLINRVRNNGVSWSYVKEQALIHYDDLDSRWEKLREEFIDLLAEIPALLETKLTKAAERDIKLVCSWQEEILQKIRACSFGQEQDLDYLSKLTGLTCKQEQLVTLKSKAKELQEINSEITNKEISLAIVELAGKVNSIFQQEKEQIYSLDYEDLQVKALFLLKNNSELLAAYQKKIKYIMVDEFQDTNQIQFEVVSLLVGDFKSDRLFVVGDPKQSIYKFRGADVSLFAKVKAEVIGNGGKEIFLKENFRSKEKVIHFVNEAFKILMGAGGNSFEVAYEGIIPKRASAESNPHVEVIVVEEEEEKPTEKEAFLVAARLIEMVESRENLDYKDIALLFRTTANMKAYETTFQRLGLPYYVFGGSGFYQKQEVQDLINLLKALVNPKDQLSLAGVLRSPLFGLSDESLYLLTKKGGNLSVSLSEEGVSLTNLQEEEKLIFARKFFRKFRRIYNRYRLNELLDLILLETHFEKILLTRFMGKQKWANVQKFKGLVKNLEDQSFYTLEEFLGYLDILVEEEARETEAMVETEEGNTVKFMTVHSSKGLEFPIIVIPDCSRQFNKAQEAFSFDLDYGIGFKRRDAKGEISLETLLRKKIRTNNQAKELAEYKRLFYVAVTRAKDYVILAGSNSEVKLEEDWEKLKSWMNWLCKLTGISSFPPGELAQLGGLRVNREISLSKVTQKPTLIQRYPEILQKKAINVGPIEASGSKAFSPKIKALQAQIGPLKNIARDFSAISVTPLMTYQQCPRRFYFQYKLRLPENLSDPDRQTVKNGFFLEATTKGRILHKVCERLDKRERLNEVLARILEEENFLEESQQVSVLKIIKPLVENYLESEAFQDLTEGNIKNELPFVLKLDQKHFVSGVIDRVLIKDQRAIVLDFKTNNISQQEVHAKTREYLLQLRLYTKAVEEILGLPVEKAQLYFLQPNVLQEVEISKESMEATIKEVLFMLKAIENGQELSDFPRKNGGCNYCSYQRICDTEKKFG